MILHSGEGSTPTVSISFSLSHTHIPPTYNIFLCLSLTALNNKILNKTFQTYSLGTLGCIMKLFLSM